MLNFNSKLLKLIKLAIKLINKLIFTIMKIEKTYEEAESKVEHLSTSKTDLTAVLNTLEKIQAKLEGKKND